MNHRFGLNNSGDLQGPANRAVHVVPICAPAPIDRLFNRFSRGGDAQELSAARIAPNGRSGTEGFNAHASGLLGAGKK